MNRHSLDDLQIFAAIARHRSFRGAAVERGVSASALSQAMRNLEERLGMRLLNRTTRSVTVTEAGEQLLRRLKPALDDIIQAVDQINSFRNKPTGTLRINAPGSAVDHVLGPMIAPFLRAYPDIHLEIVSDAMPIDIVEKGYDGGVRFGEEVAKDMIAVPLGPSLRYAVVASPDYISKHGHPKSPNDLLNHQRIRHRFPNGSIYTWKFKKGKKEITVMPEGPLTLNSRQQQVAAAIAGLGLAYLLEDYVLNLVKDGKLVEVLADWSPRLPSWYLYYPSRRHVPAAMRAFLDFNSEYKW